MKLTKQINIGGVPVGGGAPIAIQSMTNTDTRDAKATLAQIRALAEAGCDIVRCAVPDKAAAEALRALQEFGFADVQVVEIMLRYFKTEPNRIRPEDMMIGHTGYLIFAVKTLPLPEIKPAETAETAEENAEPCGEAAEAASPAETEQTENSEQVF